MTSKPVKKPAFGGIRSRLVSLPPSPFALQLDPPAVVPEAVKDTVLYRPQLSGPSLPASKPLPVSVEVWLEPEARADREVHAWACLARSEERRGIFIALNFAHRLVANALQGRDDQTLAFLVALPLAEILLCRRREPFVAAALDRVRVVMLPPNKRGTPGWLVLGEALAASPQLKTAAAKLASDRWVGPHLILNVRLDSTVEPTR
ncbi:MAG: hypothetical protein JO069_06555 [Verrucomicrobia bacterium]|nr:hypothetical protein [Verrucomicrobiota bacterium]